MLKLGKGNIEKTTHEFMQGLTNHCRRYEKYKISPLETALLGHIYFVYYMAKKGESLDTITKCVLKNRGTNEKRNL